MPLLLLVRNRRFEKKNQHDKPIPREAALNIPLTVIGNQYLKK
jgi:hypothetical protein